MQILPSTWQIYGDGGNINNPADAIRAARILAANGVPTNLQQAIFAYNHSAFYVRFVLSWAARYAAGAQPSPPSAPPSASRRPSARYPHPDRQRRDDRGVPYWPPDPGRHVWDDILAAWRPGRGRFYPPRVGVRHRSSP